MSLSSGSMIFPFGKRLFDNKGRLLVWLSRRPHFHLLEAFSESFIGRKAPRKGEGKQSIILARKKSKKAIWLDLHPQTHYKHERRSLSSTKLGKLHPFSRLPTLNKDSAKTVSVSVSFSLASSKKTQVAFAPDRLFAH